MSKRGNLELNCSGCDSDRSSDIGQTSEEYSSKTVLNCSASSSPQTSPKLLHRTRGSKSSSPGTSSTAPAIFEELASPEKNLETPCGDNSINVGNLLDHEDAISRSSESNKSVDVLSLRTPDCVTYRDLLREKKSTSSSDKKRKSSSWYNVLNPTYKSKTEDFKRLFKDLPDTERLIVDYSCAIQKDILVHGRLYISQNFICFYANIFRWETFLTIRCKDITSMTKEKTALVIPNAIQVSTVTSEKHFFTSFGARDKAYLMLFRVWQNALLEQPMLPHELWTWIHYSYGDELGLTSDDDDYVSPPVPDEDLLKSGSSELCLGDGVRKSGNSIDLFVTGRLNDKMPPKRSLSSGSDADTKRRRKAVTLETKLEILRRIGAGERIVGICKSLGLAKSTVQTIRKNEEKIISHLQSATPLSASKLTRQRSSKMERMEKLLSIWIEDSNQRRMPMSQMLIQEKAKSLFEDLKNDETDEAAGVATFQASRGWFEKFKNRQNLRNIKMKGEAASADLDAAKEYPDIFKRIVESGGYLPEQVFNVNEAGLYWKRMPERTYIARTEKMAPGYKVSKERLTLLLGANASGDFKLKPLLVYFSENPRPFKGLDKKQLPVIWRSNKNAWITRSLFEDWFKNYFYPEVKKYLQSKNLSKKALLFLDNAPGHPVNLSELPEDVKIEYLPKNTTALIQPMDQGAIATFKAYYLRRTFQHLVNQNDGQTSIRQFWKMYNIRNAVDNISESWKELKSTTMNSIWENLWPECVKSGAPEADPLPEIRKTIVNLANQLGFEDVEEGDVLDLLNADGEPLSNEELIQLETETMNEELIQLENDQTLNVELIQLETDQTLNEEPEAAVSESLFLKDLSKAMSYFQQGMDILIEADPDEERSFKVSQSINQAIACYKELQKEAKKETKQQILDQFFSPGPSATAGHNEGS